LCGPSEHPPLAFFSSETSNFARFLALLVAIDASLTSDALCLCLATFRFSRRRHSLLAKYFLVLPYQFATFLPRSLYHLALSLCAIRSRPLLLVLAPSPTSIHVLSASSGLLVPCPIDVLPDSATCSCVQFDLECNYCLRSFCIRDPDSDHNQNIYLDAQEEEQEPWCIELVHGDDSSKHRCSGS
jgi:hypothetical protein